MNDKPQCVCCCGKATRQDQSGEWWCNNCPNECAWVDDVEAFYCRTRETKEKERGEHQ